MPFHPSDADVPHLLSLLPTALNSAGATLSIYPQSTSHSSCSRYSRAASKKAREGLPRAADQGDVRHHGVMRVVHVVRPAAVMRAAVTVGPAIVMRLVGMPHRVPL
jgi:hypothetical protein